MEDLQAPREDIERKFGPTTLKRGKDEKMSVPKVVEREAWVSGLTFSSRKREKEVMNPANHMYLLDTSRSRSRLGLSRGYSLCCRHTTAERQG